jgi:hypothetical protein
MEAANRNVEYVAWTLSAILTVKRRERCILHPNVKKRIEKQKMLTDGVVAESKRYSDLAKS